MTEHDSDTCPACQIERDTGETAPPSAHRWRAPTAAELAAHEATRPTLPEETL